MGIRKILTAVSLLFAGDDTVNADQGVMVLVDVLVKPGQYDKVLAGFKRSQGKCVTWDGCRRFEIGQSQQDENHLVIIETWDSIAQHQLEIQQTTSSENFAQFRQLLRADLSFHYLSPQ